MNAMLQKIIFSTMHKQTIFVNLFFYIFLKYISIPLYSFIVMNDTCLLDKIVFINHKICINYTKEASRNYHGKNALLIINV